MSRQAATLVALAVLAAAGAALSAGAWLLLWRQVRRRRGRRDGADLTPETPSSRNDQTEEAE